MEGFAVTRTHGSYYRLQGALDADTSARLIHAVASDRPVTLDLAGCTFIDSAGLSALLTIRGDERDALVIENPPQSLIRLLAITNLFDHFVLDDQP